MPNANVLINSLNTGEVSGLVSDRSDLAKYGSACKKLENFVPLVEGGAKKMPGTYFAGSTANGGAMFTASIAGTTMTVTAVNYGVLQVGQELYDAQGSLAALVSAYGTGMGGVGTYTISTSLTVASTTMQTASNGMSRLVPFQFSTLQGVILEFSAGIVRVWEGAREGDWSLGLALNLPVSSNYNPATSYVAGNNVQVGPTAFIYTPNASGNLYITAPYGTTNAGTVPITFTVNSTDSLAATITGVIPNQGFNIALAKTTAAHNSAAAIQAAIRALGSLNSTLSNHVDLTAWTVTPDSVYYASPWITF
jgi:hypothetical protein